MRTHGSVFGGTTVCAQLSWTKLLGAPITVELDGLDVVASLKTHVQHRERILVDLAALNTAIEGAGEEARKKAAARKAAAAGNGDGSSGGSAGSGDATAAKPADSAPGWTEKLLMRLIDVLRVRISNVHIRIESVGPDAVRPDHPFSIGVRLEELRLLSLDERDNATDSVVADVAGSSAGLDAAGAGGFIRKRATVSGLSLYDCGGLVGECGSWVLTGCMLGVAVAGTSTPTPPAA